MCGRSVRGSMSLGFSFGMRTSDLYSSSAPWRNRFYREFVRFAAERYTRGPASSKISHHLNPSLAAAAGDPFLTTGWARPSRRNRTGIMEVVGHEVLCGLASQRRKAGERLRIPRPRRKNRLPRLVAGWAMGDVRPLSPEGATSGLGAGGVARRAVMRRERALKVVLVLVGCSLPPWSIWCCLWARPRVGDRGCERHFRSGIRNPRSGSASSGRGLPLDRDAP